MPKTPPRNKGRIRRASKEEAMAPAPVRRFPRTTVEEVYGCLAYAGPPLTIAAMDEAVLREARKHK
jgi:hypothetical protein